LWAIRVVWRRKSSSNEWSGDGGRSHLVEAVVILVVGAGPAGLMAAWRAASAGHEVTVVERADRVGGMAGSFEVAGQRVDFGSHRLHPSTSPHLLEALRGLLGDDLQTRPRHGRIRLEGRWIGFPLKPADLLLRLPPKFAARAALDAATAPLRRPKADTFAEVVRAGLGPAVANSFYDPYIRKIWGVPPEELSGELARRRVSASSPTDIVRRLASGRTRRGKGLAQGQVFLSPRRGYGQISEALAEAATAAGANIRLGTGFASAHLHEDGVSARLADGTTIDAERLWSTAPLPALALRLTPTPPPRVIESAAWLNHRALVLVYLVLDRPQYTEFDAHYFPGLDVATARLSEPKNYRSSDDDPPDRTVLCAELPCSVGDETWAADADDLGKQVADDLERLGLPPARAVATEVRRLPRVYPIYRVGFEKDLAGLEQWGNEQPRLLTFGRQGLFVPDNTHHALAMGWAAADAMRPDGGWDQAAWDRARDSFRDFVVED
jgi:protoporphyrinogen oxidase